MRKMSWVKEGMPTFRGSLVVVVVLRFMLCLCWATFLLSPKQASDLVWNWFVNKQGKDDTNFPRFICQRSNHLCFQVHRCWCKLCTTNFCTSRSAGSLPFVEGIIKPDLSVDAWLSDQLKLYEVQKKARQVNIKEKLSKTWHQKPLLQNYQSEGSKHLSGNKERSFKACSYEGAQVLSHILSKQYI